MIETVFFDLDGTLLDTLPDLTSALNHLLQEEGHDPLLPEAIRSLIAEGAASLIRLAFRGDKPPELFERRIDRFRELYRTCYLCEQTRPFDGIESLLDRIEAEGLKWGVVTNKLKAMTEPLLERFGLLERASAVVSMDECQKGKPDPSSLLLACQRAGVSPERCLYVGDAPKDIEAGRRAGMKTVAVRWGYLPESPPIETWRADLTISHPSELWLWIHSLKSTSPRPCRLPIESCS